MRNACWHIGCGLLATWTVAHSVQGQQVISSVSANRDEQRTRILLEISEFKAKWQIAWRESEDYRRQSANNRLNRVRDRYIHCHPDVSETRRSRHFASSEVIAAPDTQYPMIKSRHIQFSVCPSWQLADVPLMDEETAWRDGALLPAFRTSIRHERARVLNRLREAAIMHPRDGWIAGQLVRYLIDQQEFDSAVTVASGCTADAWWCAALLGLANARSNRFAEAEVAFRRMRENMDDSVRCRWDDLRELFAEPDRRIYSAMNCFRQRELNRTIWWLSDPLFRIAGNERYVEQDARLVEIELRSGAGGDERFTFRSELGGDALVSMLYRYGWPSYTAWGGARVDDAHRAYLERTFSSRSPPPYTSFEYLTNRLKAIPSWRAIEHPFESVAADWTIPQLRSDGATSVLWWPVEHFRPTRPIGQLPEGQTVLLRRQTHIEVASSVRLDPKITTTQSDIVDAIMLVSRGPDNIDSLDQKFVPAGSAVVLRGLISSEPAIVAIETSTAGAVFHSRTRFGIAPPPTLSAMQPGELALSAPVLINIGNEDGALRLPTVDLIDNMSSSVRVPSSARQVGVYWEIYGDVADDTVDVTIRVSTEVNIGLARRIGIAARVSSDPNSAISVRWKETELRHVAAGLVGIVPVHPRAMMLDLAQLAAGPYQIEIEMSFPSLGRSISSQRRIQLID